MVKTVYQSNPFCHFSFFAFSSLYIISFHQAKQPIKRKNNQMERIVLQEEKADDYFDSLPDAILLDIFNKLLDAKSLTRCLVVCKRFSSLIPQINNLFLSIIPRPRRQVLIGNSSKRSVLRIFLSKLKCFRRLFIITPKSSAANKDSIATTVWCPALSNSKFREIKYMNVQFPVYGNGNDDDYCFIKWKAAFGRELKSCIILGATLFCKKNLAWERIAPVQEEEHFLTDDQLKLRIVWTISCLISSSARHQFLKPIVSEHSQLQRVVLSDCKNQGQLCMDEEQIAEMRKSVNDSSLKERTPFPDLSIKMLYLPVLELPASGYTMRGATLVVIRPDHDDNDDDDAGGDLLGGWFDGDGEEKKKAFGEAVRELMKVKKSYVMTMNSF